MCNQIIQPPTEIFDLLYLYLAVAVRHDEADLGGAVHEAGLLSVLPTHGQARAPLLPVNKPLGQGVNI